MSKGQHEPGSDSTPVTPAKIMVGSQEWCAFPQLGVPAILARVDSGARTSSIHAFNIQPFTRKGQSWVSFEVHPVQSNRRLIVRCEAPVVDHRPVKSSSGIAEKRYVIQTVMRLWDHEFVIEVTLANRDSMGYRMLLGREAMVGRIVVDPELSYCLGEVSEATLALHYKDSRRSSDGLRIALLGESEKFYTNRRLIEACEERGHFPSMLNVRSCFITLDSDHGEIVERDRGVVPAYDAVVPRFAIEDTLFGTGVLRQYSMNGGVVLNQADALMQCRNKLALFQKMAMNDIPICPLGFASSTRDLEALVAKLGCESYRVQLKRHFSVKPSIGVNTSEETSVLEKAWRGLPDELHLVSRSGDLDGTQIKALVVSGRIISAIQHDGNKLNLKETELNGYDAYQLSKEEKKLVLRIVKLAGLSFATVELIRGSRDEHPCFLLDVVASGSIEAFEKVTGKDIASLIVIEIERICDWQQQQSDI